jgi:hypothetical protein
LSKQADFLSHRADKIAADEGRILNAAVNSTQSQTSSLNCRPIDESIVGDQPSLNFNFDSYFRDLLSLGSPLAGPYNSLSSS